MFYLQFVFNDRKMKLYDALEDFSLLSMILLHFKSLSLSVSVLQTSKTLEPDNIPFKDKRFPETSQAKTKIYSLASKGKTI